MAAIQLCSVLIAPVDPPGSAVELDVTSLADRRPRGGESRSYGGRLRLITDDDPGAVVLQVEVKEASRAVWLQLREWSDGRTLLWRDHTGRKVYGYTLDVPAAELIVVDDLVDIAFTFTELTVDEAV